MAESQSCTWSKLEKETKVAVNNMDMTYSQHCLEVGIRLTVKEALINSKQPTRVHNSHVTVN